MAFELPELPYAKDALPGVSAETLEYHHGKHLATYVKTLNDLVAGHIPMMFSDLGPATGLLEAKRVRPLAISTKTRHPSFPDIPPLGDAVPGYEAVSWQAMAAPARTPRPILDKLNAEITAVLAMPEMKEQTLKYGFLPLENRGIDELKEFVKGEIVRWGKVVGDAGIAGSQ